MNEIRLALTMDVNESKKCETLPKEQTPETSEYAASSVSDKEERHGVGT